MSARPGRHPALLGATVGLLMMILVVPLGYAWGEHNDPPRSYCDFYPSTCAQNGGRPPEGFR